MGKMWWHWSNENRRPGDKHEATGSPLFNGRAWWHFENVELRCQWVLGKLGFSAEIGFSGDENEVSGNLCVPGVALYWGVSGKLVAPIIRIVGVDHASCKARAESNNARGGRHHRYAYEDMERRIGIRIFGGALWWQCWDREAVHFGDDPWWMRGNWHPLDTLLGRHEHRSEELQARDVQIPMPEGNYTATAKLERATWKRPRWPFAKTILRVSIDIPKGIPVPGKGENSWDCGPDATFGLTTPARTIEDGIGQLVASVLHDRKRRGAPANYSERADAEVAQA